MIFFLRTFSKWKKKFKFNFVLIHVSYFSFLCILSSLLPSLLSLHYLANDFFSAVATVS